MGRKFDTTPTPLSSATQIELLNEYWTVSVVEGSRRYIFNCYGVGAAAVGTSLALVFPSAEKQDGTMHRALNGLTSKGFDVRR